MAKVPRIWKVSTYTEEIEVHSQPKPHEFSYSYELGPPRIDVMHDSGIEAITLTSKDQVNQLIDALTQARDEVWKQEGDICS